MCSRSPVQGGGLYTMSGTTTLTKSNIYDNTAAHVIAAAHTFVFHRSFASLLTNPYGV